ncbi:hypothetical protein ABTY59_31960 [Streptomyces sp. NPDC096079]|uniref:hypothetical protein n=1 Tax=Streptomyces sp. NPDC096079 TaxID=3155820 RepID=UPI00331CD0AE
MHGTYALKSSVRLAREYGALRTIQNLAKDPGRLVWRPVDIHDDARGLYVLAVREGSRIRHSRLTDRGAAVLDIHVTTYTEPGSAETRYAVTYDSRTVKKVVDHQHRAIAEAEYERLVRSEYARQDLGVTLPLARLMGGLTRFYDETDVI